MSSERTEKQLRIDYWLPISKVAVSGSVVRTGRNQKSTPAIVTVVTRPDHDQPRCLSLPESRISDESFDIGLTQDGLLTSVDAKNTDHRWELVAGVAALATTAVAIGASLLGPGTAGAAAVALAGSAVVKGVAARRVSVLSVRAPGSDPTQPSEDDFKAEGIEPRYVEEHPFEARLLLELRSAEADVRVTFAASAARPSATDLHSNATTLRLIREELGRSEATYQAWLDARDVPVTTVYNEEVPVVAGALPTETQAQEWWDGICKDPAPGTSFVEACKAFGIVVAIDIEHIPDSHPALGPVSPGDALPPLEEIRYRALQPAVMRCYVAQRGKPLVLHSLERLMVAVNAHERAMPVLAGKDTQSLTVEFDGAGALIKVASQRTGSAASAAAALAGAPSSLKDAFDAGTDLAAPFTAAGRAKALEDRSDVIDAEKKLNPTADPNQQLLNAVATAELQARLRVARDISSGRVTAAIVIGGSGGS